MRPVENMSTRFGFGAQGFASCGLAAADRSATVKVCARVVIDPEAAFWRVGAAKLRALAQVNTAVYGSSQCCSDDLESGRFCRPVPGNPKAMVMSAESNSETWAWDERGSLTGTCNSLAVTSHTGIMKLPPELVADGSHLDRSRGAASHPVWHE